MAPTKNLLLRLDPGLAEQLAAIAAVEDRPVSEVVREAIAALVEERRKDRRFQKLLGEAMRDQQRVLDRLRDDR